MFRIRTAQRASATKVLLVVSVSVALAAIASGQFSLKVLRTDEEKLRYLNTSQTMKQNLFFNKRPILYITRYNCDCNGAAGPPSGNNQTRNLPFMKVVRR